MTRVTPQSAAEAGHQLHLALVQLAAQGGRPRCAEPDADGAWLSDNREDRKVAAACCTGCPVLAVCGAAAEAVNERFGVWGGVDRTPRGRSPQVERITSTTAEGGPQS